MKYNIINQKFDRWTAINFAFIKKNVPYWECLCDCGNIKFISVYSLIKGKSKSCGCLRKDFPNRTTHGFCGTRFHTIWKAMRQRCTNPNAFGWYAYGGRGIKICDRWLESFENFRDDMYESYLRHITEFGEKDTSIDREDSKEGYSKENCQWATRTEQSRNTRSTAKPENWKEHQYWRHRLSSYLNQCLNKKINSVKFEQYFGIDLFGFISHIESQFKDGMTWKNHSNGLDKWNLGHLIPCYTFDLSKEEDRLICFNYKNFQPQWWKENDSANRKRDTLIYA